MTQRQMNLQQLQSFINKHLTSDLRELQRLDRQLRLLKKLRKTTIPARERRFD